jgi:hypothetical protein
MAARTSSRVPPCTEAVASGKATAAKYIAFFITLFWEAPNLLIYGTHADQQVVKPEPGTVDRSENSKPD